MNGVLSMLIRVTSECYFPFPRALFNIPGRILIYKATYNWTNFGAKTKHMLTVSLPSARLLFTYNGLAVYIIIGVCRSESSNKSPTVPPLLGSVMAIASESLMADLLH